MSCVPFSEDANSLEPLRVAQGFRGPGSWWPCSRAPTEASSGPPGMQGRRRCSVDATRHEGTVLTSKQLRKTQCVWARVATLARFCSCCSELCELLSYFPAYSVVVRGPGFPRRVAGRPGPRLAGLFPVHQQRPTSWPPFRSLSSRQPPASS